MLLQLEYSVRKRYHGSMKGHGIEHNEKSVTTKTVSWESASEKDRYFSLPPCDSFLAQPLRRFPVFLCFALNYTVSLKRLSRQEREILPASRLVNLLVLDS